jgi:hypothetical protein
MSSALPPTPERKTDKKRNDLWTVLGYPARIVGFWTAVVLPFVLLALIGLGIAQQSPLLVLGLVTVNVAGLVLGNDYKD